MGRLSIGATVPTSLIAIVIVPVLVALSFWTRDLRQKTSSEEDATADEETVLVRRTRAVSGWLSLRFFPIGLSTWRDQARGRDNAVDRYVNAWTLLLVV